MFISSHPKIQFYKHKLSTPLLKVNIKRKMKASILDCPNLHNQLPIIFLIPNYYNFNLPIIILSYTGSSLFKCDI